MAWFTHHFPRVGHIGFFQIRIIINKATVNNFLHNFVSFHEFQLQTSQCPLSHIPLLALGFGVFPCHMEMTVSIS